jgi:hypothetical protein
LIMTIIQHGRKRRCSRKRMIPSTDKLVPVRREKVPKYSK